MGLNFWFINSKERGKEYFNSIEKIKQFQAYELFTIQKTAQMKLQRQTLWGKIKKLI
jgi:hypothetical protein